MAVPHSDLRDVGPTAVLIPLRSLDAGKLRLADAVDPATRKTLIRSMAETVVRAAHDLDVLVVYEDEAVRLWAESLGARAYCPSEPGLNRAIAEGREELWAQGYDRVIIAHADLPFAKDLRIAATSHRVTIVPDRHRDGTNVMSVPSDLDFTFSYGAASFDAHVQECHDLGIEPHILDAPDLAWDVDHPNDLIALDMNALNAPTAENT